MASSLFNRVSNAYGRFAKTLPEQAQATDLQSALQVLGAGQPLPSANPNDLVPGTATLDDVQGRLNSMGIAPQGNNLSELDQLAQQIAALSKNPTDPILDRTKEVGKKKLKGKKGAEKKTSTTTQQPGTAAKEPEPSSNMVEVKGRIDAEPSTISAPLSEEDQIRSLLADRRRIREQQQALGNPQGDPWMRALAGLGGLGADVMSPSGPRGYMNRSLYEYDQPFEQKRQMMLRALDGEIADQNPLIQLAIARANRDAAFQNQKSLLGMRLEGQTEKEKKKMKATEDYRNKKISLEERRLNNLEEQQANTFLSKETKNYVDSLDTSSRLRDVIEAVKSGELKSSQNVVSAMANDITQLLMNARQTAVSDRQHAQHALINNLETKWKTIKEYATSSPQNTLPQGYLEQFEKELNILNESLLLAYNRKVKELKAGTKSQNKLRVFDDRYNTQIGNRQMPSSIPSASPTPFSTPMRQFRNKVTGEIISIPVGGNVNGL